MKIQESKHFIKFATALKKTTNETSEIIINFLLDQKLIAAYPDYYNTVIRDIIDGRTPIKDFVPLIQLLGFERFRADYIIEILSFKLFGDYDCERCGGQMEPYDCTDRIVGGDGYETPLEFEIIILESRCLNCGLKQVEKLKNK